MEETKMDAVSVYNQVKTCLKELHDAGLHIKRERLQEIVSTRKWDRYPEMKEVVSLMQTNMHARRALFRLDALSEFGASVTAEEILDQERHTRKQGRHMTVECILILLLGLLGLGAYQMLDMGVEPQYVIVSSLSQLILVVVGMGVIHLIVNTDSMGVTHSEDGIQPIIDDELYDDTHDYLFDSPNDLYVQHRETGYILLPTEAFALASYLVKILNHPKVTNLLGDRSFKDLYSKEYRKIYSEIGNCYRLFDYPSQEEIDDLKMKNRAKNGGPQIYNLDTKPKKRKKRPNKKVEKLTQNGKVMRFELEVTKGANDDH